MTFNAVATFLLVPPVNLLLLAIAGFVLGGRWRRCGRVLCGLGLAGLLVLSLPVTSDLLFAGIERFAAPPPGTPPPAAIVILSADVTRIGDTPASIDVGLLTLERIRAGAALARASGLPVLVSGGVLGRNQASVALLMARSLEADFSVPVRWQEDTSRDTWENAANSAALLRADGIRSVFLVTHAWHMRRALIAFRHFGIEATPAPVPFARKLHFQAGGFVPTARSLADSYYALHEWVGWLWYTLRAGS
jgi:uncharacterized SAM-binding protein YcdF (DUF218 family)